MERKNKASCSRCGVKWSVFGNARLVIKNRSGRKENEVIHEQCRRAGDKVVDTAHNYPLPKELDVKQEQEATTTNA